MSIQLQCI